MTAAASTGLLLHVLNLTLLWWLWARGAAAPLGVDTRLLVPVTIRILAWGFGFSALALAIVWRAGHRYEVLVAGLFVASYSLWGGVAEAVPLVAESWWRAAFVTLDALTHAVGVRFTQLFPSPLRREDLLRLGPRWLRRTLMPALAALLDPRLFWPFAIALEAGLRLLPASPGLYGAHVLLWVTMAATYLYGAYRRGSAEDRQRIFWILEGVVAFVAAQIVFMALWALGRSGMASLDLTIWAPWLWALTSWITLACFALAVFYYGALDSALVLRRTTVLSASGALAVLIFVAMETAIEQLLSGLIGVDSGVGALLGGIVAGLTFHPISVRIDRLVQQRVQV